MDLTINSPYQDKLDRWSSHSLIQSWLVRFPPGTRVLDIGTATGTLGRLCQDSGFDLSGLEPQPHWANQARPYYREVLACDLDTAPDDFISGHDVVVCADVLEHMCDSEQALARLAALQPRKAVFIISVPNIANLWIRLNLLFGRFDYTDRGLLDRTHTRFFTRRTFIKFLQSAGLAIDRIEVTPVPLPLVSPFFKNTAAGRLAHNLLAALTRAFPTLLGYQFVAQGIKP